MIITDSIESNSRCSLDVEHIAPNPSYNYAGLCSAVPSVFGLDSIYPDPPRLPKACVQPLLESVDHLVLLFVDAFGWNQYTRLRKSSWFLQQLESKGVVSQLTSQFPSTTAAHVSALHFGGALADTEIPNWFYFEPSLGRVIAPLRYMEAGSREGDGLANELSDPSQLFPERTMFHHLAEAGVECWLHQSSQICDSVYSRYVSRAGNRKGYDTFEDGLTNVVELLGKTGQGARSYHHLYYDEVDRVSHASGPFSDEALQCATTILSKIEEHFYEPLQKAQAEGRCPKRVGVLLVADHGHVSMDPDQVVYLNESLPELLPLLRKGADGEPLCFGGTSRDAFLYVQPDKVEAALNLVACHLEGHARVVRVSQLVEEGYFLRSTISEALNARLGDIAVLPEPGKGVLWYHPVRFPRKSHKGSHGGLTKDEMLIPLGVMVV